LVTPNSSEATFLMQVDIFIHMLFASPPPWARRRQILGLPCIEPAQHTHRCCRAAMH
jgi:hypothetical protein